MVEKFTRGKGAALAMYNAIPPAKEVDNIQEINRKRRQSRVSLLRGHLP